MKWIQHNEAVYYSPLGEKLVRWNIQDVLFLKNKLISIPEKRARICAHQTANAKLHEMLIVAAEGSYIRPPP